MFMYTILKVHRYSLQKSLKTVSKINHFAWKEPKYRFCQIKQVCRVQEI